MIEDVIDDGQADILVVDDVPANLSLLTSILREQGYKVYAALNGRLALQALESLKPDLILLDIKMPEMNGYEVCNTIRSTPELNGIPVIFISALDDPQDKVKAFVSGGVDYINKPFHKDEVLARVKTHVDLSRYQKALARSRERLEIEVQQRTQELATSERRLKQAQGMALLGSWEYTLKEDRLDWSEEIYGLFGLKKDEFSGSYDDFLQRVHPDDRAQVEHAYREAVAIKRPYDQTHRIIRADNGAIRYLREQADPVTNGEGETVGSFGTSQDITDLMEADQERQLYLMKFRHALKQTIEAVAATLEKRDPYTAGHQRNVALLAEAIAVEMGLADELVEGIRLGSSIHDIGKIHIPAEILNRPGKLSAEEFNMIKTHAIQGYEILKDVDFPWPVAGMIRQHHERLNGSGYPDGLKEDEILLESKIIAVADVVEAMASHRPYRPALGLEPALEELVRGRGDLFDPVVVDSCLRLFREKDFQLTLSF